MFPNIPNMNVQAPVFPMAQQPVLYQPVMTQQPNPTMAPVPEIFKNVNLEVQQLITPIMMNMTSIYMLERSNNGYVQIHDQFKLEKEECVHIIFNGNNPEPMLYTTHDGKLKCKCCGKEIYSKFDDGKNVEICTEFRKVVEQMLFFGMINNMKADLVAALIQMKKSVPVLAKIVSEFNEFVRREDTNADSVNNIGNEYLSRGITSGF